MGEMPPALGSILPYPSDLALPKVSHLDHDGVGRRAVEVIGTGKRQLEQSLPGGQCELHESGIAQHTCRSEEHVDELLAQENVGFYARCRAREPPPQQPESLDADVFQP